VRKRLWPLVAAAVLGPFGAARASVPVEQVEAYDPFDSPPAPTGYAPLNFNGQTSITLAAGQLGGGFAGITFINAVPGSDPVNTESGHANYDAHLFYVQGTPAYPYVNTVYCAQADNFLNNIVLAQNDVSSTGPVPLGFNGSAKVISNSYIGAAPAGPTLDLQRRYDFMAAQGDATVVAAAVTGTDSDGDIAYAVWSSFNTLAVSGVQSFNPAGSPGKQHADLFSPQDASFATALVSGYAAALYGTAQAAGQADGEHTVVVRSLLMAGADKTYYSRQTANNLSLTYGAGNVDYAPALSILQNGEKPLTTVTAGAVTGTPSTNQKGWSYGTVARGGGSAVLITAGQTITGLTASLNWNVTSNQPTPSTIDTTNAGLIFPNLTFELRPVNRSGSTYVLGTSESDVTLHSAATGDNVQYLYFTGTLPAGTYALLVGGDASLPASVGISYMFAGSFASAWNLSTGSSWGVASNWTNGIPDAQAAVANLGSSPGLTSAGTITLDSNRTVGKLNFTTTVPYTIASGTGGVLFINDTGDSSGTIAPTVNVSAGAQTITAPVSLANGVNAVVASGASLTISGNITGGGVLAKSGAGLLVLNGTDTFGDVSVTGGTLSVGGAGSISGALTVTGATATFGAANGSTPLVRTLTALNVSGATVSITSPSTHTSRTLLVTTTLTEAGSAGAWNGTIDLGANDLDVTAGSLATITSQVAAGYNERGGANWRGTGITSTAAASATTHLTALGVVQNNQSGSPLFGAANLFDGYTPAAADILVKYTYFGDANLDGKVDGSDYSLIDAGYASHGSLTGWYHGDFNYDGVIDGSDYALVDNAFNNQATALSDAVVTAQVAAVPEPACLGVILGLGLAAGIRRRRIAAAQL
jgi:hypothetical protein